MAQDPNGKIILEVDTTQIQKEVDEATAKLRVMKNQLALLEQQSKSGGMSLEDYAKKSNALKAEIAETTRQQTVNLKIVQQYTQHNNAAAGSVDALKAELALLTTRYNALSEEERKNSAIGKELTRQTKEVSDKLKEAGKAIGDNRREVGSYREAIEQALIGNTQFAEGLSIMREGFSTLKDTFADFGQGIKDRFAEVDQGVKGTSNGIANAHKAAIGLGIGLKAIGIGFIVAAIAGLVNYFAQTREGAEKIGQAFAYLSGIVDELARRSAAFGKAIFDAVTQPMKQVEKLGNFLKLAFTDPQEAIAQLKKNVNSIVVDLDELGRAANKSGLAMMELKKASQLLERDRINNIATSKELIRQEEALKNIRDNEFNSIDKRIAANEKAATVERQRLKILEELAQRNVALLMKEASLRGGIEKLSNEQLQTLREAELELADLREESIGRENELITNRYQLQQEKIKQREEAEKAAMERRLNREKLELQLEIERAQEGSAERVNAELKMLAWERDQKQKEYEKGSAGYKLAQVEYQNAALKLAQDHAQSLIDIEKKRIEDFKKLTEQEYNEQIGFTKDYYTQKDTELLNQLNSGLFTQEEFNRKQKEMMLSEMEAQIENAKSYGQRTIDLENELAAMRVEVKRFQVEEDQRLEEARYQFVSTSLGAIQNLISMSGSKSKEAADFAKALTLFQIGIDTARSISQIVTLATSPTPDAIATGGLSVPIKIAALSGAVLANFAQIKNMLTEEPPEPGFYDGGFTTKGNPREQATNLGKKPYVYHKSEYVTPHDVIEDPAGAFYVNQLEALRLKKRGFYDGGFAPAAGVSLNSYLKENSISVKAAPVTPIRSGYNEAAIAKHLARELRHMPAPIVTVKDIAAGQKKVQVKQSKTDI